MPSKHSEATCWSSECCRFTLNAARNGLQVTCKNITTKSMKSAILYLVAFTTVENDKLGTLRSEDGDGRESVAEKVNSRSFNLHGDYSKSLTLSNVGEPS